jgi:fido (protein-threonine AMPylation protein)
MESKIGVWQTIPGETPIDPSDLKDRSITTRAELCKAEAINISKAHIKYLASPPTKRRAPFDYAWLLRLHKEMYCDVMVSAGQLRQIELTLGITWHLVRDQVFNLTQDLPVWEKSGMPIIEEAARLHHRAVWIHPFNNGNGRWARLLANIWLGLHKSPIVNWPYNFIGQESPIRADYVKALKYADEGDYGPLIALHNQYLGE